MKRKKTWVAMALTIAVFMTTGLTGCGGKNAPAGTEVSDTGKSQTPAEESGAETPLRLGLSMNTLNDVFRNSWAEEFERACGEQGIDCIITNADLDVNKQISDVDSLITQKVDVILITPVNQSGAAPAFKAANKAGIPTICVGFDVEGAPYDVYVAIDEGYAGELQADYLKQWLEEDPSRVANIGYLVGEYSMETAMPRMYGFYDSLPENANKVAESEGKWLAANAVSLTEDWMQAHPEINVYACMNDDMAVGVIQALKAANVNFDDVLVIGVDGLDAGKQMVRDGYLDFTAGQDIGMQVTMNLDIAKKLAAGEAVDQVINSRSFSAITKETVDN